MKIMKKTDFFSGLGLMVISAMYFLMSFQIKLTSIGGPDGSRLVPQILGVVMFLLSSYLCIQSLGKTEADASASASPDNAEVVDQSGSSCEEKPEYFYVLITLAAITVYVFFIDKAGFLISTFLFLTAEINILNHKHTKKDVILSLVIALVSTLVIYFAFVKLLNVILPAGILAIY